MIYKIQEKYKIVQYIIFIQVSTGFIVDQCIFQMCINERINVTKFLFLSYNVLLYGLVGKLSKSERENWAASWGNELSVLRKLEHKLSNFPGATW